MLLPGPGKTARQGIGTRKANAQTDRRTEGGKEILRRQSQATGKAISVHGYDHRARHISNSPPDRSRRSGCEQPGHPRTALRVRAMARTLNPAKLMLRRQSRATGERASADGRYHAARLSSASPPDRSRRDGVPATHRGVPGRDYPPTPWCVALDPIGASLRISPSDPRNWDREAASIITVRTPVNRLRQPWRLHGRSRPAGRDAQPAERPAVARMARRRSRGVRALSESCATLDS